jgi:hypothetical protein
MPQENPVAINNYIQWLNMTYPPGPWVQIHGWSAITNVTYGQGGAVTFNPTVGFPVKGFINMGSGEVKIVDARRFHL